MDDCELSTDPKLVDEQVSVLSNDRVAPSMHMIELAAPAIAAAAQPGQFIHLQVPDFEAHVLRRPFSLYSWSAQRGTVSVLYQTVGQGTRKLASVGRGTRTRAIGPVGHGWNPPQGIRRALLVCGGVGVAPLTMLAQQLMEQGVVVHCLLGATTKARLVGDDVLEEFGVQVHVCSDDGSVGHHGFCTDLIDDYLPGTEYVAICGPAPMEKVAVTKVLAASGQGLACEVSMERRMACGVGACLSCVVDTTAGKKRACVDGPVFDSREVVWR